MGTGGEAPLGCTRPGCRSHPRCIPRATPGGIPGNTPGGTPPQASHGPLHCPRELLLFGTRPPSGAHLFCAPCFRRVHLGSRHAVHASEVSLSAAPPMHIMRALRKTNGLPGDPCGSWGRRCWGLMVGSWRGPKLRQRFGRVGQPLQMPCAHLPCTLG